MSGRDQQRLKLVQWACTAFCLAVAAQGTWAQAVYRCEANGRVAYSHEPCPGAKAVDTTPTQGLDQSSGVSRKGADVRRDETNRTFSEAVRPITGKTHEERITMHRRIKLSELAKVECRLLDERIPAEQAAETQAAPSNLKDAQMALFKSRKRYRELGC